jgi:hypothetical protein
MKFWRALHSRWITHNKKDLRGPSVTFSLDNKVTLVKDQPYLLKIETLGSGLT